MKQNLHCGDTLHLTINFYITNTQNKKLITIDIDKLKLLINTVANNYLDQCKQNASEDYFMSEIATDKRMI